MIARGMVTATGAYAFAIPVTVGMIVLSPLVAPRTVRCRARAITGSACATQGFVVSIAARRSAPTPALGTASALNPGAVYVLLVGLGKIVPFVHAPVTAGRRATAWKEFANATLGTVVMIAVSRIAFPSAFMVSVTLRALARASATRHGLVRAATLSCVIGA